MNEKIVFFNVGWMDSYKGLRNDTLTGGGKYNHTEVGHEIFNFKEFRSGFYGYVQPKINENNPSTIKIEKLGAIETDQSIQGITVVWTASDPVNGGTYIIGWYKNAVIYRICQDAPNNSNREYENESFGYFTKSKNVTLLSIDERNVLVQRRKKNWMGQSNVWYADKNPEFVKLVKDYIFKGIIPLKVPGRKKGKWGTRQSYPLKRIEVETKAVLFVTKYYKALGYEVQSFEKDNVGWDLSATNNKTELKLEVKGLSGTKIATELTPNEFKNLNQDKNFYRLCIVTNVLAKPILKIFAYSNDDNEWTSNDGTIIKFEEVVSARIYV